jgi:hypothetical protein
MIPDRILEGSILSVIVRILVVAVFVLVIGGGATLGN